MKQKNRQSVLTRLLLTAGLLALCVILTVGVTLARYQKEETDYLKYGVRENAPISVWADFDKADADLIWSTTENGMSTLSFYVSNSTSKTDYADEDVSVSIRLLGSLALVDAQVFITVTDGTAVQAWAATPMQIREGTPLFDTFGEGNAYMFLDENGSELEWKLEGGSLSLLQVRIDVVREEASSDAALLQLQIEGK